MTAALGTLVFLVTLWALAVTGAALLEDKGARILAALKGEAGFAPLVTAPARVRRTRLQPALRVKPKLRAAA